MTADTPDKMPARVPDRIGPALEVLQPISLEVVDSDTDHFIVYFDRPGRIEVSRFNGQRPTILAHVYEGTAIDMEQSPLFAYDGTLTDNEDLSR